MFDSILAGAISAICTKTAVAPLERLKMLKQSQMYYKTNNYTGFFDSFRYIYSNEGFKGFFRGNTANLSRVIPAYMLKFPLNEFYKSRIGNMHKFENLLLAGTAAGFTQALITHPLDMLRTRMALDNHMTTNYTNLPRCFVNIIKTEGPLALYKGLSIALTLYPLYIGIQFSLYEWLKEDFGYFSGTMAGVTAQTLMFPGDVLKRQLQINGVDNTEKKINGPLDCIRYIHKTRGFRGFYQGYGINLIKVMPEVTIQFFVYEAIKKYLKTN
jgi:hypothetical protein